MVSVGLAFCNNDGEYNGKVLCWSKLKRFIMFASGMLCVPSPKFPPSLSVVTVKSKNLNTEISLCELNLPVKGPVSM